MDTPKTHESAYIFALFIGGIEFEQKYISREKALHCYFEKTLSILYKNSIGQSKVYYNINRQGNKKKK